MLRFVSPVALGKWRKARRSRLHLCTTSSEIIDSRLLDRPRSQASRNRWRLSPIAA